MLPRRITVPVYFVTIVILTIFAEILERMALGGETGPYFGAPVWVLATIAAAVTAIWNRFWGAVLAAGAVLAFAIHSL